MKIAYFNANLKVGQDGVTRVIYRMIDGALERKHETIAITSTLPEINQQIVPMYKVPSVVLPLQKSYRIAIPGYNSFAEILFNFKPDILHINSPCTLGFGAIKYAREYKVPIIATYHTHFPKYPRYYKLTKLENLTWKITQSIYNQVDLTLVPAQPILLELTNHNIERLKYLPNGVDTKLFNPSYRNNQWRKQFGEGTKPIILFVSRLVWEKDLKILAKAYNFLRSKREDFEMVIVGDGHARKDFEQIMPGAHFLGYQSGIPLSESFASSDIFVFPSTTETFGLVTLEAMASGIAPVAAKIGGAVELIEENISGLFSIPYDGLNLAKKIEILLDHPSYLQKMKEQALLKSQQYEWNKILNSLFNIYEEVISSFKQNKLSKAA